MIEPLAPGQSVDHTWTIEAILEGDYMVYIVVIPEPESKKATSQPVSTSGVHLTVTPFLNYNPGGVLPVAIGIPAALMLGTVTLHWVRRRRIDTGGAD